MAGVCIDQKKELMQETIEKEKFIWLQVHINIHKEFDREYRDKNRKNGMSSMFECPRCSKEKKNYKPINADYNAARNLATSDIEKKICLQCKEQGIEYKELPKD